MDQFKIADHEKNILYIYADGAVKNNQKAENIGSWACAMYFNNHYVEYKGAAWDTTNNRMELFSLITALSKIKDHQKKIRVYMDSQYVVSGLNEWSKNWRKNGFKNAKNEEIKNMELWRWLLDLVDRFGNIEFFHCDGHTDVEGNNIADKLCNLAIDEARES